MCPPGQATMAQLGLNLRPALAERRRVSPFPASKALHSGVGASCGVSERWVKATRPAQEVAAYLAESCVRGCAGLAVLCQQAVCVGQNQNKQVVFTQPSARILQTLHVQHIGSTVWGLGLRANTDAALNTDSRVHARLSPDLREQAGNFCKCTC